MSRVEENQKFEDLPKGSKSWRKTPKKRESDDDALCGPSTGTDVGGAITSSFHGNRLLKLTKISFQENRKKH